MERPAPNRCCLPPPCSPRPALPPPRQVLNMKPPEILGLLEEAAGTKMYESKKQAALRTLEKKQIKLDEITKVGGRGLAGGAGRDGQLGGCLEGCSQLAPGAAGAGRGAGAGAGARAQGQKCACREGFERAQPWQLSAGRACGSGAASGPTLAKHTSRRMHNGVQSEEHTVTALQTGGLGMKWRRRAPLPALRRRRQAQVLQDEIMPALDKLRKEKQQYNEWQGARDSVDKLQRFCVAYNYVQAQGCARQRAGRGETRGRGGAGGAAGWCCALGSGLTYARPS